jgi:CRISP-associated protein Cas1
MARLRTLPKVRDSISFLYFEHCRIEQDCHSIAVFQEKDCYRIPCANIRMLMLGPGSTITHAAVKTLTDNACEVQWVGENTLRFYASGRGVASNTERLLHQAGCWADGMRRLAIVRRMYLSRFDEVLKEDLTLQQIRGLEGVRMRTLYRRLSEEFGVEWKGRDYKPESWDDSDEVNRALSIANSCLYAVCLAAMNSVGYSPGLGFIHTGKPLSFIYDVADLYKAETSIPAAFEAVSDTYFDLESIVRRKCRERFQKVKLMRRIIGDVDGLLGFGGGDEGVVPDCYLWDDQIDRVEGGKDWSVLGEVE